MTESKPTIDITDPIPTAEQKAQSTTLFQPLDRYFLGAALASLTGSVGLWFLVDQPSGLFVGLWVPSILGLWAGVRLALLQHTLDNH
jgi:hypothetical protein